MKVSELAKAFSTTVDTVRYYTRLKMLNPIKSENGYKYYPPSETSRFKFILRARQLGFSVSDIQCIIDEASHGKAACPLVRSLIKERLAETEKQFQEMLTIRKKMRDALFQWESKEDKAPTSTMVCHLIDSFEHLTDEGGSHDK
jgi:DNA-binding transcriptional MerR regulator